MINIIVIISVNARQMGRERKRKPYQCFEKKNQPKRMGHCCSVVLANTHGTSFNTRFCINNAVCRWCRHAYNLKITSLFIKMTRNHDRVFRCNFMVLYGISILNLNICRAQLNKKLNLLRKIVKWIEIIHLISINSLSSKSKKSKWILRKKSKFVSRFIYLKFSTNLIII